MNPLTFHFFCCISITILITIMDSEMTSLMRVAQDDSLRPPHIFLLMSIAEILTSAPFAPTILRHWNIERPVEWAAVLGLSVCGATGYFLYILGAELMPLGDFAAFIIAGILLTPMVYSVLYCKCLSKVEVLSFLIACIGIVFVSRPTFVFGNWTSTPITLPAFLVATLNSLLHMIVPFIFVIFSHLDWNCLVLLRGWINLIGALLLAAVYGDWSFPAQTSWKGVVAALLCGTNSNIYRWAIPKVYKDMEVIQPGSAGVLGNIVNTFYIPSAAIFALVFFNEALGWLEVLGCGLIFISVVVVLTFKLVKGWNMEEEEEMKEEERKKELLGVKP